MVDICQAARLQGKFNIQRVNQPSIALELTTVSGLVFSLGLALQF